MGTMQGWVTRNRLREEQERSKIEQARKEGFDDGYLSGKTFACVLQANSNIEELQRKLKEAVGDAAILAHAYSTDNRPPTNVVVRSIERGKRELEILRQIRVAK
jgi:hypothetical protein